MKKNDQQSKKEWLWTFLFIAIAAISVWAIVAQSKSFSLEGFWEFIRNANPVYIGLAVVSMLGFVFFEGCAIQYILKELGYKRSVGKNFVYSAADVYFSAITPSASGGQPAAAFFMMRQGIPGSVATVTLVLNLLMYAVAVVLVGGLSLALNPSVFMGFHISSRIIIVIGFFVQAGVLTAMCLLLWNEKLLERIVMWILRLLNKIHLLRHAEKLEQRLQRSMAHYREYATVISGRKKLLLVTFLFNLLQRVSTIAVALFVYLAAGGEVSRCFDVWSTQNGVVVGSNCAPIPGAMGVFDYLMLDGFKNIVEDPTNLELFSRSISFYSCVFVCGITILIAYIRMKKQDKKGRTVS